MQLASGWADSPERQRGVSRSRTRVTYRTASSPISTTTMTSLEAFKYKQRMYLNVFILTGRTLRFRMALSSKLSGWMWREQANNAAAPVSEDKYQPNSRLSKRPGLNPTTFTPIAPSTATNTHKSLLLCVFQSLVCLRLYDEHPSLLLHPALLFLETS